MVDRTTVTFARSLSCRLVSLTGLPFRQSLLTPELSFLLPLVCATSRFPGTKFQSIRRNRRLEIETSSPHPHHHLSTLDPITQYHHRLCNILSNTPIDQLDTYTPPHISFAERSGLNPIRPTPIVIAQDKRERARRSTTRSGPEILIQRPGKTPSPFLSLFLSVTSQ